jgi:hypothetical protein
LPWIAEQKPNTELVRVGVAFPYDTCFTGMFVNVCGAYVGAIDGRLVGESVAFSDVNA